MVSITDFTARRRPSCAHPDGCNVDCAYNLHNFPRNIIRNGSAETYSYDAARQVASASDGGGFFDAVSRLLPDGGL